MRDSCNSLHDPAQPGKENPSVRFELCQNETMKAATEHLPSISVTLTQLRYHLRTYGFAPTSVRTVQKLAAKAMSLLGMKRKSVTPAVVADEVLGLQPTDWVEVKSEEEIRSTLDSTGKHRGLAFTEEMLEYCGQKFRVLKRVGKICMEGKGGEMRTLKDTVSLEGVVCNGGSRGCDRACLMFWREAWLRRIKDPNL